MKKILIEESNKLVDSFPFGSYKALISTISDPFSKLKANLSSNLFNNSTIFSDSRKIISSLKLFDSEFLAQQKKISIIYLVNPSEKLVSKINAKNHYLKHPISTTLLVSKTLQDFVTYGPENISSFMAVFYGIRAFLLISNNWLGIHASSIYDVERDVTHLIFGQTTAGKSSSAYLIEMLSKKKYIVINDDWSEIDLQTQKVFSPITYLSEPREKTALQYLSQNSDFKKLLIESTSKKYFVRINSKLPEFSKLGKIFQLDIKSRVHNPFYIFRKNNSPIPFMNVNLNRNFFIDEMENDFTYLQYRIQGSIYKILHSYDSLSKKENYHIIDSGSAKMELVAQKIYQILTNNF